MELTTERPRKHQVFPPCKAVGERGGRGETMENPPSQHQVGKDPLFLQKLCGLVGLGKLRFVSCRDAEVKDVNSIKSKYFPFDPRHVHRWKYHILCLTASMYTCTSIYLTSFEISKTCIVTIKVRKKLLFHSIIIKTTITCSS